MAHRPTFSAAQRPPSKVSLTSVGSAGSSGSLLAGASGPGTGSSSGSGNSGSFGSPSAGNTSSSNKKLSRDTIQQLQSQMKRLNEKRNRKGLDGEFNKAEAHLSEQLRVYIEELARRRMENLNYLQKTHEGKVLWFNVVHVVKQDLTVLYANEKHRERAKSFFNFGLSLGVVLNLPDGQQFVRAMAQLLEEYKYHMSNPAFRGIVNLTKGNKSGGMTFAEDSPVNPEIQFHGNTPQFNYLLAPLLNMHVDYYEVVMCLLQALLHVYEKFLHPACQSFILQEAIVRIDARITSYILDLLIADVQKIAQAVIKRTVMAFKPPKHANREQDSEEEEEEEGFEDSPFDMPAQGSGTSVAGEADNGDADDLLDDEDDEDEGGNSGSRRGSSAGGRSRATNSIIVDPDAGNGDENAPPEVLSEKLAEQIAVLEKVREDFNKVDDACTAITKRVTALSYEVSAQSKVITMLEEQKKLLEMTALGPQVMAQFSPEEKAIVLDSARALETQHATAVQEHQQLQAQLARTTEDARSFIRQRNAAKPGMITQSKKVERLERLLANAKVLYTGDA